MPEILITIDGELALTVEQAAQRYGLKPSSMRAALANNAISNDGKLDGRKPLYLATRLDALIGGRPGKGAPGVARPHRPGASTASGDGDTSVVSEIP